MKVSDYIVNFLADKKIEHVFGYPGGMVTHLMDSFSKVSCPQAHTNYHEQASAFCACGYAQASGRTGVAYATSGPGATNMITGICNAYFDSIPIIFITGQVNSYEMKSELGIRQKGFQETDITSMVQNCTKYCECVVQKEDIRYCLEKAYYIANEGRPGPVLLDIPMDVLRGEVDVNKLRSFGEASKNSNSNGEIGEILQKCLMGAKKPCVLIGAGVKIAGQEKEIYQLLKKWSIPVVSSMIAYDIMGEADNYYGYIGAYGDRQANFIVAKCDMLLVIGSRLDIRQVGVNRENFAQNAKVVRIDIDRGELDYKIHDNDICLQYDVREFIKESEKIEIASETLNEWKCICNEIRDALKDMDASKPNDLITVLSKKDFRDVVITTDVGQNQVWIAQSYKIKGNQKVLFSGGHGAMGYSLPAAIGAYYGSGRPVICFNGDGGFQMNMQECQFIAREKLPILIVIINNYSLGMIRHFQEMYFNGNYFQTKAEQGYVVPQFRKIAEAFGFRYQKVERKKDIENFEWDMKEPTMLEIILEEDTYVFPKLEFGKPNQDQEPLIPREIYNYLLEL